MPDETRRVPRRARRQLALFDQQHVGQPHLAEMVSDRAPDDAAADDDDLGGRWQLAHEFPRLSNWAYAFSKRARFSAV